MVAWKPDPWECENCGHINTGNYTRVPCYHHVVSYVSYDYSSLDKSIAELAEAIRRAWKPWTRDAKPDVPRKLGFRRYAFLAPAARVRLCSVQFAIL
jgi:hypothetical protein